MAGMGGGWPYNPMQESGPQEDGTFLKGLHVHDRVRFNQTDENEPRASEARGMQGIWHPNYLCGGDIDM